MRPSAGQAEGEVLKTVLTSLGLGLVSLLLFLWRVDYPPSPYYDEPQYINAARAILSGLPNPNPEAPPLGKLLLAASMRVLGDNPLGWRAVGALCGALTLVGVFLWALLLLRDYTLALAAAILTLLNNFLFVMSRVAMMDISLVCFLIWALAAFTAAASLPDLTRARRRILLCSSGVGLGLACACKWNGMDTLAVVLLMALCLAGAEKWSHHPQILDPQIRCCRANLAQTGIPFLFVALLLFPLIAYSLTYWPLCLALHRPFNLHELISMNVFIWRFHRAVPGNPGIASKWYSWMLQVSPQRALSYLVGNWAVMWAGLLSVAFCARRFGKSFPHTFLVLLYAANLLQWAVTPQKLLYYYYYFPASMLLGVSLALAFQDLPPQVFGIRPRLVCVIAAGCVFLFCFPHMAHLDSPFDCALGCWP